MTDFVKPNSIVRKIWGRRDTVLFIFAGAAAEFALNKAVDWLYFTGRLPADPIGRLFSTVTYAQRIVFSSNESSLHVVDRMRDIHSGVEQKRNASIPDWAYRDVLYMLIHYSIASYEALKRKLTQAEKIEVYDVFKRVGLRMGLKDLPDTYLSWIDDREKHLNNDLEKSTYTSDLFMQYKKHLGHFRYRILLEAQILVTPPQVKQLLNFRKYSLLNMILPFYKFSQYLKLDWYAVSWLLPVQYKKQIKELSFAD